MDAFEHAPAAEAIAAKIAEMAAAGTPVDEAGATAALMPLHNWSLLSFSIPGIVNISIGGIAGTVGIPAYAVWIVSMLMGFIQSFTYAEIAGLFPNKSGGASVYGAAAWLKYSKFIAPLSVWCNWFAWSPVLSLGSAIAAGYILDAVEQAPTAEAIASAWL